MIGSSGDRTYPGEPFVQQVVAQIPWGTLVNE